MEMSPVMRVAAVGAGTVVVVAVAAGVAFGARSFLHNRSTDHVSTIASFDRVVVDTRAGDIEVTADARGGVDISNTSTWFFSKPRVREYVRDDVLHIETRGRGFLSSTDFRVRIPSGVPVDVSSDAGDITVTGTPGDVSAASDTGDVRIEVDTTPRRIDADSDAGDVEIAVPRGAYRLELDSDVGDDAVRGIVRSDRAPRSIRATTDVGDVSIVGR